MPTIMHFWQQRIHPQNQPWRASKATTQLPPIVFFLFTDVPRLGAPQPTKTTSACPASAKRNAVVLTARCPAVREATILGTEKAAVRIEEESIVVVVETANKKKSKVLLEDVVGDGNFICDQERRHEMVDLPCFYESKRQRDGERQDRAKRFFMAAGGRTVGRRRVWAYGESW